MPSVTWMKIKRVMKRHGVKTLVKTMTRQTLGAMTIRSELRKHHVPADSTALLKYTNEIGRGLITPFQVEFEIVSFLDVVRALQPKRVMEIGTANGGTLFMLTRVSDPSAKLISLDLPGGDFGEGYARWRTPIYKAFALAGQTIELVRGDSHNAATPAEIEKILGGQQLDLLFIDGDHTYEGVKKDYDMYKHLVRKGGVIAFHDIAHHVDETCQVDRFWAELKDRRGAQEWIADANQAWAGIGMIRVE